MGGNPYAQALINQFESCRLAAYQDEKGIWTAGWGETQGVGPGTVFTQTEADARRDARIAREEAKYIALAPGLSAKQYGALISLFYNAGENDFAKSTLLVLIRSRALFNVTRQILSWDHARLGGKEVEIKGLLRRRLAEALLFVEGWA